MNPEGWELPFLAFREWQCLAVRTSFWPKMQENDRLSPLPNADSATPSTCQILRFNSHTQMERYREFIALIGALYCAPYNNP